MIHKCLVVSADTQIVSDNYLFGGVFHFDNWTDGALTIYTNRLVDVASEIINKLGITITAQDLGASGIILTFGFPGGETGLVGDIIFKDVRNLILMNMYVGNNIYPYRRMKFSTSIFGNVSEATAYTKNNFMVAAGAALDGDIADFGKFIRVPELRLSKSQNEDTPSLVSGTLESLAESQIAFGRTSGTLKIIGNGIVTAGGVPIANLDSKTITFANGTYSIA